MYCLNEILLSDEMALKTVIKLLVVVVDGMLNCCLLQLLSIIMMMMMCMSCILLFDCLLLDDVTFLLPVRDNRRAERSSVPTELGGNGTWGVVEDRQTCETSPTRRSLTHHCTSTAYTSSSPHILYHTYCYIHSPIDNKP